MRHEVGDIQSYIRDHDYEIATLMTKLDWLQVYSKSVSEYDLDMDHVIRETRHPERY